MSTSSQTVSETPQAPVVRRGVILAIICLAQFMVVLDATVVNVMIPQIRVSIPSSLEQLQWVMIAYVLVFGGFMLLGGRLTDLVGRRQVFVAGLVVFTAASLLSGVAGSVQVLIASRALQGLGAAALSPAALSILVTTYTDPAQRAKALGVWGTVMGMGASFGTLLGGAVIDVSWRLGFLINVPVGVVLLVVSLRLVPKHVVPSFAFSRLDVRGAALGTAGLVLLIFGVTSSTVHGWVSWQVLGSTAVAALLLTAFYRTERTATVPMLPLGLFKVREVRAGTMAQLASAAVMLPFFFLLPQYMQDVLGYSPMQTGLAYIPTSLAMILVSAVVPMLVAKWGSRAPYVLGVLFLLAAALLMTRMSGSAGYWSTLLPITAIMGVGLVICMMVAPIVGTSRATEEDAGAVSAVLNSASEIGGAIGLAVAVTAVSSKLGNLTSVGASPHALNEALHYGAVVMAILAGVNIIVGLFAFGGRAADEQDAPERSAEIAQAVRSAQG